MQSQANDYLPNNIIKLKNIYKKKWVNLELEFGFGTVGKGIYKILKSTNDLHPI